MPTTESTETQNTENNAAPFISEAELMKRIPLTRKTLKNHRDAGKIPFVKLGSRVLYHWPTVEQALLRKAEGGQR